MTRKSIKELQRKCNILRRNRRSFVEFAESLIELALTYQEKGVNDEAVATTQEAVSILENGGNDTKKYKLLFCAYRCLAEVFAAEGKREEALCCSSKCRKAATASGNHSRIQLSLHISAWVFEKLWVVSGSTLVGDLEQAYDFAKKSLNYLDTHGTTINHDTEDIANYDAVDFRRANLERLLSGIAGNLDKRTEAEKYLRSAMNFAKKKNLSDLRYELQIVQLDFSWVDKKKLAQILVNEAPAKRKCGAKLEQSQVLIYCGDMERAFDILLDIMAQNQTELAPEDLELLRSRIIFVYKFVKALKRSHDENIEIQERRKIYEQMGDWILEYSSNNKDTLRQAIGYYSKMLTYSLTDEEKIPALISLGQTYLDLQLYEDAVKYFEKCLEYERRSNVPLAKSLTTRMLIFDTKCKSSLATAEELQNNLNQLLEDIPVYDSTTKSERCQAMADFLASEDNPLSSYYAEKATTYLSNPTSAPGKDENMEREKSPTTTDNTSSMDINILLKCERLAKLRNEVSHIEKRKNWRNNHGETELHLEAKGDNSGRLKLLLQHGYHVNARDNSGWTPLHEATNHKKIAHVKILLNAGARVDAVSNVGDDGGLDEGRIGGKITPLMDACANLAEGEEMIEIAELLYKHDPRFVTLKNEDGWTAVDFLSDSIKRLDKEDDAHFLHRASKLLVEMKAQFIKEGVAYSAAPAITRIKRRSAEGRTPHRTAPSARVDGVTVYQNAISNIGSRSKKSADSYGCHEVGDKENYEQELEGCDNKELLDEGDEISMLHDSFENVDIELPVIKSFTKRRVSDDFFIDDMENSRKRKTRELLSSQPKRKDRGNHVLGSYSTPHVVTDNVVRRRSLSPVDFIENQDCVMPSVDMASTPTQDIYSSSKQFSVEISFLDSDGEQLRKNILAAFESSETVRAIHERCQRSLFSHQKEFIIYLEDDTEVDLSMPLSMLGSAPERIKFKCVVQKPSAQVLFQCYNQDIQFEKDIIDKLRFFSLPESPDEINFSQTEIDYCIQPLFRSLVDSSKPIKILNLNFCNLGKCDALILQALFINCRELSIAACNITDAILTSVSQGGTVLKTLSKLDISFNPVSAAGLGSLLALCPSLFSLTMKGLNLQGQPDLISELIGELMQLKILKLGNTLITSSAFEHIFSSCNQLEYLDVSSAELGFSFSQCWLPSLKRLRMAGCSIHKWESFIDWISIGCVEHLDLSCTSITADSILSLCERRMAIPILFLRLLRCPRVEHSIEYLKNGILSLLQTRECFLRLQLPSSISHMIKLETAYSSDFLSAD